MNKDHFKAWAARLSLSETSMAAYLGVPVPTYRKWESGARKPDSAPLRLFAVLELVETRAPDLHAALIDAARGQDAPAQAAKPGRKGKGAIAQKNAPEAPPVVREIQLGLDTIPVLDALPAWMTGRP